MHPLNASQCADDSYPSNVHLACPYSQGNSHLIYTKISPRKLEATVCAVRHILSIHFSDLPTRLS